jgi:hypothetical protein
MHCESSPVPDISENRKETTMKASQAWTIVIVLQVLILLGQWVGVPSLQRAEAQIPDTGQQNNQIIDQLKSIDSKLDRIASILESGKLQVKAAPPDDKQAGPG